MKEAQSQSTSSEKLASASDKAHDLSEHFKDKVMPSSVRVRKMTPREINKEIDRMTSANISQFVNRSDRELTGRIKQLDLEWDIERALATNFSIFSLFSLFWGLLFNSFLLKWIVPFTLASFLLQHCIQGWCPPLPIFRRLGFRTAYEIDTEKVALKFLRGDFENISREKDDVSDIIHSCCLYG